MIQYGAKPNLTITQRVGRELRRNKVLYIMAVPVILYFALFHYGPMYGVMLAFKDYRVGEGIWQSPWVGMKHFINFWNSPYFFRTVRNTLLISVYSIIFGFPAPILLALLLNAFRVQADGADDNLPAALHIDGGHLRYNNGLLQPEWRGHAAPA